MLESAVEDYLVERVKQLGGEVRKVVWLGRQSAPDRLVMLPTRGCALNQSKEVWRPAATIWVELKNPDTIKTFPANARERAQAREHERMRRMGQHVVVVGTIEGVNEVLG
jgi:hypothetical protein